MLWPVESIQGTRVAKVLNGFRQFKPVEMTRLEEILIGVSLLVTDFPEILELDINPLMVNDRRIDRCRCQDQA